MDLIGDMNVPGRSYTIERLPVGWEQVGAVHVTCLVARSKYYGLTNGNIMHTDESYGTLE